MTNLYPTLNIILHTALFVGTVALLGAWALFFWIPYLFYRIEA